MDCHEHCNDGCCGCGHEHGHEPVVVRLALEDGAERDFTIIGAFDVDGKQYFAMTTEGDEGVMLCRYAERGEETEIWQIESDEEYEEAAAAFEELYGAEDE